MHPLYLTPLAGVSADAPLATTVVKRLKSFDREKRILLETWNFEM